MSLLKTIGFENSKIKPKDISEENRKKAIETFNETCKYKKCRKNVMNYLISKDTSDDNKVYKNGEGSSTPNS